jgi:hypothetical protein
LPISRSPVLPSQAGHAPSTFLASKPSGLKFEIPSVIPLRIAQGGNRLTAIKRHTTTMKATLPEPEIVTRKGKPVSVIIPIKHYEELLERAEDADDVAWLKRARKKPLRYRPLEDYLAGRKRK